MTKIVKFVLLSHSALVNIRVQSALRTFCPSKGTSSVKNGIQKGNVLDDQGGVYLYKTLLSTPNLQPIVGWIIYILRDICRICPLEFLIACR